MKSLLAWLDHRTGYRGLLHEALYERIPGGARWRYVWGSTLVLTFITQMITGVFLWMVYSPSAQTAWESVFYIQYELTGGWLLRGIHHYSGQAMVVLLAIHFLQVVIDGAYRAPREVNFWCGLLLMMIVLGLSLTGYLLPWDQKGYWATNVATELIKMTPIVGEDLQKLVMGADEYGHSILSRFLALHAGVLPGLLIVLLVAHIYFFRRHGIHAHKPDPHLETTFWPDQILKDAVASLAVLAVVLLLVTWGGFTGDHTGQSPGEYLGADLGSPADPASLYEARPEWYFLFLFQFLKFFPGETEVIGAIVIPGVVFGLLFLMPLTGRWKLGHRLNVAFVLLLLVGAVGLTGMSLYEDRNGTTEESRKYLKAVAEADVIAERVVELAQGPEKIPPAGALELLRNDPLIQGPRLFERDCLSCHEHTDREGNGIARPETKDADPDALTGADLYNFASRPWIAGLLDPQQIAGPRYFQHTTHVEGEMISYVQDELSEMEADDVKAIVAALSAEAKLPYQAEQDREDADLIETGRSLIVDNCTGCHKFRDDGEIIGEYPDLTGYGSRKWIMGMIKDPTHERYYGDSNDRMPSFAEDEENPDRNRLTQREIRLLADWLRNDWYRAEAADAEDAGEQAANDQDDTGQDAGEQDAADETPTEKTPTDEASAAQETDTPDPEAGTSDGTEESGETSVEPADGVSDGSEPDATEPDSSESDTAADTEPPQ